MTNIAAGGAANHSLFLKSDGSLWVMGYNYYGELGDGSLTNTARPEQIVAGGVTNVAAGSGHSLFIKTNGSLWAMGENINGELGNGTYSSLPPFGTNRPQQIVSNGVTAIAAGWSHSLFLKSDGSLWAMGANANGQLGDGTLSKTNQPEQIVSSGVTAIAAGTYHSLFLKSVPLDSSRSLWAMGENNFGQLGDGNPIFAVKRPEQIVAGGVAAMAAGYDYSLFLQFDGSLWVMGVNNYGQLGDGFLYDNVFLPKQIFPPPRPVLVSALFSQANLQFTATCGFGGNFYLLCSTNLALPLSQWTPVWTNTVITPGTNNFSVTLTNIVNLGGRQFYSLQSH